MKKILALILAITAIATFFAFAVGSSSDSESTDQGKEEAEGKEEAQKAESEIADCSVEILGCRLAQDYTEKPVVIVKYAFTNNSDDPKSFMLAFDDAVYQNGIGLNESWVLDDSANYSADNQTKDIQKGATLEVEVAYELNDTTTDVVVELSALSLFASDKKITKTFTIA